MELTPVDPETFMMRMIMIRFQRDDAGNVTGFEYSNPVVRRIRFARLPGSSPRP